MPRPVVAGLFSWLAWSGALAQSDVVFTEYSPFSGNAELAHRLLSPLAAETIQQRLTRNGKQLDGQPIDITGERFTVYVPRSKPSGGYGVLVFVSPWDDGHLPKGWAAVFDEQGMIYVSASHSGNEADVLTRRAPLAILAATNVMRQFPVDPQRVYISGFSGGSRAALRVALGYPDLFRGALLDAGADPIGNERIPLPPQALFQQFQSTRILFVTGSGDDLHLQQESESAQSLRKWCVTNVSSKTIPNTRHELMSALTLHFALTKLGENAPAFDPAKTASCNASIVNEMDQTLRGAADYVAKKDRHRAHESLMKLDARYGGLAGPRLIEMARECDCGLLDQ